MAKGKILAVVQRTSRGNPTRYHGRRVQKAKLKRNTKLQSTVAFGLGLPRKALVTHKFNEIIQLQSAIGIMANHSFSCNGMFKPNISGGAAQPYYFDQFSALYDHYCVIGSRCVAKVTPSTTGQTPIMVALWLNDDTSVTKTAIDLVAEDSASKYITIPAGSSAKTFTLSSKWSAKKTFGKGVLANTDLQGTSGANPNEQTHFNFSIQAMDKTTTVTCLVDVRIEFIAVWKELKDIAAS